MKTYSTLRNTGLAAVLVATLAGLVTNGLALDQRIVYERDVLGIAIVRGHGDRLLLVRQDRRQW
mgnify:CR=1 FL=1